MGENVETKGVKAHFAMDDSGIVTVTSVESVFEKTISVEEQEKREKEWKLLMESIGLSLETTSRVSLEQMKRSQKMVRNPMTMEMKRQKQMKRKRRRRKKRKRTRKIPKRKTRRKKRTLKNPRSPKLKPSKLIFPLREVVMMLLSWMEHSLTLPKQNWKLLPRLMQRELQLS